MKYNGRSDNSIFNQFNLNRLIVIEMFLQLKLGAQYDLPFPHRSIFMQQFIKC